MEHIHELLYLANLVLSKSLLRRYYNQFQERLSINENVVGVLIYHPFLKSNCKTFTVFKRNNYAKKPTQIDDLISLFTITHFITLHLKQQQNEQKKNQ